MVVGLAKYSKKSNETQNQCTLPKKTLEHLYRSAFKLVALSILLLFRKVWRLRSITLLIMQYSYPLPQQPNQGWTDPERAQNGPHKVMTIHPPTALPPTPRGGPSCAESPEYCPAGFGKEQHQIQSECWDIRTYITQYFKSHSSYISRCYASKKILV